MNVKVIAFNSFKTSIREPVFFVMLAVSILLIGFFPICALFSFGEQIKMVIDSSMGITLVMVILLSVLLSDQLVSKEISTGNIMLVFSKPVSRSTFIIGTLLGLLLALGFFVAICAFAMIISCYIAVNQFYLDFNVLYIYYGIFIVSCIAGMLFNLFKGYSFSSSSVFLLLIFYFCYSAFITFSNINYFDKNNMHLISILLVVLLLYFAVCILLTVTILLATKLDLVANLVVTTVIFFLGLLSDYIFAYGTGGYLTKIAYAIVPNWQFFWLVDAATSGVLIPYVYVLYCLFYTIVYMLICTVCAIFLMSRNEIGRCVS